MGRKLLNITGFCIVKKTESLRLEIAELVGKDEEAFKWEPLKEAIKNDIEEKAWI